MKHKEALKIIAKDAVEQINEYLLTQNEKFIQLNDVEETAFADLPNPPIPGKFLISLYSGTHSVNIKDLDIDLSHIYTDEAKHFYAIYAYLYEFTALAANDSRYRKAFESLGPDLENAAAFIGAYGALVLMFFYNKITSFNDETLYLFLKAWKLHGLSLESLQEPQEIFNKTLILIGSVVWSVLIRTEPDQLH